MSDDKGLEPMAEQQREQQSISEAVAHPQSEGGTTAETALSKEEKEIVEKEERAAAGQREKSSTERVYEAVRELRELDQMANRVTVADLTGLKLTIVDDRLRALVDDGRLRRLIRGNYEVVNLYAPARAMSFTVLNDGRVKIEIGDAFLDLTPVEARRLARSMAGFVEDARLIESGRQQVMVATELASRVEGFERALEKRTLAQQKENTRIREAVAKAVNSLSGLCAADGGGLLNGQCRLPL